MTWDDSVSRGLSSLSGQSPGFDWLALWLSNSSVLWVPGVLLTAYWIWLTWREALLAGPVLAGAIGIVDFLGARLKDIAARPRPCMAVRDPHALEACGKTFSFPSNHALNTATAAAFFQVLYPKSGWVSWPLVAVIGLTRVYLGAHYLTDVLGGWLIGGLFGAGAAWLLLRWRWFRGTSKPLQHKVSLSGDA